MLSFYMGIFLATFIVAIFTTRFFKLLFWYGLNSFVLGLIAILIGVTETDEALIISGVLTIVLKAFVIPYTLKNISKRFDIRRDIEATVKVHYNIMLIPTIIVFTFYLSEPFAHMIGQHANYVSVAISALFLSFVLMIEHSNIAPRIIGFLMLENSLFLLGATATNGMPMLIEIGVFVDLMMAIVIVNILFQKESVK